MTEPMSRVEPVLRAGSSGMMHAPQERIAVEGSTPVGSHGLTHQSGRSRVVLVTDGDERSSLAVVRSLGRAGGYEVHVTSRRGHSLAGASRFARSEYGVGDPLADPVAYAEALSGIAKRLEVDTILPISEASVLAVLGRPTLFDLSAIPCSDELTFRRVCDKSAVLEAARQLGIATPRQHVITSEAALSTLLRDKALRFPLVVKPAKSVVAIGDHREKVGVSYALNPDELCACVARYGKHAFPLLLQERIVGPGVGVFILRWEGQTLATFSHRRVREKPPSGGVSVCAESTTMNPALLAGAEALLERFGWRGVAMVEYKLDQATGTPYLMEINGRFWGSLQLAISAGVDFPSLLLAAATGQRVSPVTAYRVGIRNRWWWGEVDHIMARLRHSQEWPSLTLLGKIRMLLTLVHWPNTDRNEVLQLDDVRPFLRETVQWLRRA